MTRLHRRSAVAAAVVAFGSALLPLPVAAVTPITFSIGINYPCPSGTGEPSSNFVIRLYAPNGDLVERLETTSSDTGFWSLCFEHVMGPGDKVRATGGGVDRTVTIPNITLKVNRVTDVASGKWIPNTEVEVCINHYLTFSTGMFQCLSETADGSGAYSLDFTSVLNVSGADQAATSYDVGADHFQLGVNVPFMLITRSDAFVTGSLNPGQVGKITLKDGSNNVRGTATVQNLTSGEYQGYFRNASGNIVRPRSGDVVVGNFASNATLTIPNISVSAVPATDVVTGHCLPNRPFELYAIKFSPADFAWREGYTDGSGNFTRDLTVDINLVAGDLLRLTCLASTGDRIRRISYVTS